jgi:hypothetical protein
VPPLAATHDDGRARVVLAARRQCRRQKPKPRGLRVASEPRFELTAVSRFTAPGQTTRTGSSTPAPRPDEPRAKRSANASRRWRPSSAARPRSCGGRGSSISTSRVWRHYAHDRTADTPHPELFNRLRPRALAEIAPIWCRGRSRSATRPRGFGRTAEVLLLD